MLASPRVISNANYARFALPKLGYVSKRDNCNICVPASCTRELEDFLAVLVNQNIPRWRILSWMELLCCHVFPLLPGDFSVELESQKETSHEHFHSPTDSSAFVHFFFPENWDSRVIPTLFTAVSTVLLTQNFLENYKITSVIFLLNPASWFLCIPEMWFLDIFKIFKRFICSITSC